MDWIYMQEVLLKLEIKINYYFQEFNESTGRV